MRVLITGAGGFVGAALCASMLRDGHTPVAVIRPGETGWRLQDPSLAGLEVIQHDIASPSFSSVISDLAPTRIFHLAAHGAYSWQNDVEQIVECNLTATIRMADAAVKTGVCEAFVHTGSSSEYGHKIVPHRESDLVLPNSVYAVSKSAATNYLGHLSRTRALPATTARLFSIYGPFEDASRLIPQVVISGLRGELPPLAAPTIARDFVYVEDAVACLRELAEFLSQNSNDPLRWPEVLNVCSGKEVTLRDVASTSSRVFPRVSEPTWGTYEARSWDTTKWSGDPRLTEKSIGWKTRTPLDCGLRLFNDWIQADSARRSYYLAEAV